jgi:uncharacterized protein (UPF0332 family)
MGDRVAPPIRRLIEERKLTRFRASSDIIENELECANYDLNRVKGSLEREDYKWATVQGYYSMFHAARALLYTSGYREKSHRALVTALNELYVKTGRLESVHFENLKHAMDLREEADYGMTFSETGAIELARYAETFLTRVKEILGK